MFVFAKSWLDSDATEIENILFNDTIYPCFSLFLIINILNRHVDTFVLLKWGICFTELSFILMCTD